MFAWLNHGFRSKRTSSLHQKRMRFFTVFFFIIVVVLFTALMWLINRPGSAP
jgi:hypothetical protein